MLQLIKSFPVYLIKQNNNDMNKQGLKTQIERLAKEEGINFIEACSAMQAASATLGNESIIGTIHDLKMEYIDANGIPC